MKITRMDQQVTLSKVPEVTFLFWIMKIAATTLGETGGDAVSMSLNLGYIVSTIIFAVLFIISVYIQVKAGKFDPLIYWVTIICTTTVGTTLADFVDRSLGIGYLGGTLLLLMLLAISLAIWRMTLGSVSINTVATPKQESFYWMTILFSQTLGTALGDWTASSAGLGYMGGIILFSGCIGGLLVAYYATAISRTALFWAAFILTRPLGAVLGDFLDKPIADGGLHLSRFSSSAVRLLFIMGCIFLFTHRAAQEAH